jgi:transcriptional regulator with GAF, ATPase, and Fis domain
VHPSRLVSLQSTRSHIFTKPVFRRILCRSQCASHREVKGAELPFQGALVEKKYPELPSEPLSDPKHGLKPPDSSLSVIVWDHQRSRLQLITRLVSECKARPCWVQSLSAIQEVEFSAYCGIALVALGRCPSPDDLGLEVIRTLKQKGFKIVCYEDGAHAWPLGTQCYPLLAGSSKLLDSANAEFAAELSRLLAQLLHAERARRSDEEKIRAAMENLGIIAESEAMISIFRWIVRVSALSDLPILIMGETGTGKQILAHAIHRLDPKRRDGPFVAVNCGAISPSLAESELFGHRRGAFTGADRERQGLIRSAQGGVLFLDEIGELDDALQTKLLRVLQESRVLGVGEDQEVAVDVRVIAATNRQLDEMVKNKKFRADLFHRLNVLSIHIPPLRERPADIRPLIEHFLKSCRSLNPAASFSVASGFVKALTRIELAGNVRQLENLVRQALINKYDDSPLNLSDLPVEVWRQLSQQGKSLSLRSEPVSDAKQSGELAPETPPPVTPSYLAKLLHANSWNLSRSLQHCEKLFLEVALHRAQGNQSQTARLLGITPRSVYNMVRKYNLHL